MLLLSRPRGLHCTFNPTEICYAGLVISVVNEHVGPEPAVADKYSGVQQDPRFITQNSFCKLCGSTKATG